MEVRQQEQPRKQICGQYRRIPCQTRSLSVLHNGEDTAYFVVPHDAPHHMPLNCSHADECIINSGRRFRYHIEHPIMHSFLTRREIMMDVYRIPHNGNVELRVEYAEYSVVLRSTRSTLLFVVPFLTLIVAPSTFPERACGSSVEN